MPLSIPSLDTRRYQDLLDETLARIPVHNPEWTNFNQSDPGVTLVELFAFLTETLLYRANQIPERNRLKFLSLLGVPLRNASPARGIVTFANDRGPLTTTTLAAGLEVRAGQIPFRTERALDVLPIEAQIYYKQPIQPTDQLLAYYQQLYASFSTSTPAQLSLYQTTAFPGPNPTGLDLLADTVDRSLWIALLVRVSDRPYDQAIQLARQAIANRTISLGFVPVLANASRQLRPGATGGQDTVSHLQFSLPNTQSAAPPAYIALDSGSLVDVLAEPGVVEVTLPSASQLTWWDNLGPLDSGVGDYPPAIDDSAITARVITWLRLSASTGIKTQVFWTGINATMIGQRAHVANEQLPNGTGAPDQRIVLSRTPVLAGSVQITAENPNGTLELWQEINDLFLAGPEVPTLDPRLPPGTTQPRNPTTLAFTLDPASGAVQFGDGEHGKRPPRGALMRADYDYGVGSAGNVGAGSINTSPALPAGLKVANPVRTWGGADAESGVDAERQITSYLQHRDRLVTVADFVAIAWRTPGVDLGRVEVLPTYNPALAPSPPGDAAGAVTLMIVPRADPNQPDAPLPDQLLLDTLGAYLDQRRLVTTEIFLCPPIYRRIWISIGIDVAAGFAPAQVREAVRQAIIAFLAPIGPDPAAGGSDAQGGWPLDKSVIDLELAAQTSRVAGVRLVRAVQLAPETGPRSSTIAFTGLELPRIGALSVSVGDPVDVIDLRNQAGAVRSGGGGTGGTGQAGGSTPLLPVPVIPAECQ
jgi:Baseplate J-like protein